MQPVSSPLRCRQQKVIITPHADTSQHRFPAGLGSHDFKGIFGYKGAWPANCISGSMRAWGSPGRSKLQALPQL